MTTLPNDIELQPVKWVNIEKKRYYHVFLSRDLLGDWVVTKSWGGLNTSIGRVTHVACQSIDEAKKLVNQITHTRKNRGYIPR